MIRFLNVSHFLGGRQIFQDLAWHVKPGDRVGLVGDNGSGKTTLLRMAAGELAPDNGQIVLRKRARLGWLKQEPPEPTVGITVMQTVMEAFAIEQAKQAEIQELYDRMSTHPDEHDELIESVTLLQSHVFHHDESSAMADAKRILSGLGFKPEAFDRPLSTFSGGWQMRVQMARLLLEQPDLLLLDEPTNHLDLESIEWLEGFLTDFPGALIVVSHDRWFLDKMTNSTAWLFQNRVRSFPQSYSRFEEFRVLEEEQITRAYANQQREIEHQEAFINRFRAKNTKATLVQSRIKQLEKLERIELPTNVHKHMRLKLPEPAPCARRVMELRHVSKSFGENTVLNDVSLTVDWGDHIALVGKNGAGKSTLLKILGGMLDHQGKRVVDDRAQIEYFSQHRIDVLNPENNVLTEARPPGALQTDEQIRSLLGCFLFSNDDVFKKVSVLSGGEKSRLALARMMLRRGNVLLLDEPTNHLDMTTREILMNGLAQFPGIILMISHDRSFIQGIANRIIEVADGKATSFLGNYADFLRKKSADEVNARAAAELEAAVASREAAAGKPRAKARVSIDGALAAIEAVNDDARRRRETAQERQERAKLRTESKKLVDKLEAEIEHIETRLALIHGLQSDPDAYANGMITTDMAAEAKTLERRHPEAIAAWEQAVDEYEALRNAT